MLNVHEPLTIYTDISKALRKMRLRLLFLSPLMVVLFVMLSVLPTHDVFSSSLRWFILAEIPVLYFIMSRSLKKQSKPIVSLSSQGITINTLCTRVGFLRWDEIKDVRAYNLLYRFVGITLHDPGAVYNRIGLKRSYLMRANELVIPLYKLLRIPVAPINIPQEYLPMSADELMLQIEAYRNFYS